MFNAPAFEMEYAGITGAGGTVQLLDAAIRREIASDQPRFSSKLFPAAWLAGCSPVPKLPRWKH